VLAPCVGGIWSTVSCSMPNYRSRARCGVLRSYARLLVWCGRACQGRVQAYDSALLASADLGQPRIRAVDRTLLISVRLG